MAKAKAAQVEAVGKEQFLSFGIAGKAPLLLHNSKKFLDPSNEDMKAHKTLTGKKRKTEDDYKEIGISEWRLSLYEDKGRIVMPNDCLESCILAGGKKSAMGPKIKAGVVVLDHAEILHGLPAVDDNGVRTGGYAVDQKGRLLYGSMTRAELLACPDLFIDKRSVVVQRNRVMRYRPIFEHWRLWFVVRYLPDVIDKHDVLNAVENAGIYCGIGDYRPKFGRFEVACVKPGQEPITDAEWNTYEEAEEVAA
jgi:hypothetical protein